MAPSGGAGAAPIEDVIGDVREFIGRDHLIAHNAKFDKRFLDREYERAGYDLVSDEKVVDTLSISRALYGRSERHNLSVCVSRERVDVDEEGFHAADFDVRMTARVFVSMMGKVETQMNE